MPMVISRRTVSMRTVLDDLRLRYLRLRSAVNKAKHKRARYRATFLELNALSDRDLADIGIPRSYIRRLALEEMSKEIANETS